jgi:hypothetical protein
MINFTLIIAKKVFTNYFNRDGFDSITNQAVVNYHRELRWDLPWKKLEKLEQ